MISLFHFGTIEEFGWFLLGIHGCELKYLSFYTKFMLEYEKKLPVCGPLGSEKASMLLLFAFWYSENLCKSPILT